MDRKRKSRTSIPIIIFFLVNLCVSFPVFGEGAGADIEAVKRGDYGTYLLDDNEDGGESFVKWSGNDSQFGTNRVSDTENGGIRSGMVRQLKGVTRNYVVNYLADPQDGSTSGANNKVDYSAYKYFGFWYRGDGTANTLTMIFKSNSASNAAEINQEIPADQEWHYVCYAVDNLEGSKDLSSLECFNIKLANQTGTVYVDELLLTEKDPTGGGGTEPTDPPEEPGEEKEPDMDWVKTDAYLLDNNEDGENMEEFIQWLGDSNFSTNRQEDETKGNIRELQSIKKNYVQNKLYDQEKNPSSGTNPVDFSQYQYFSFWYKGGGQAVNMTMAFKHKDGSSKDVKFVTSIAEGDTDWHYVSYPIEKDMSALTGFNIDFGATGKTVYLDDLLLSAVNPLEPGEMPETSLAFYQNKECTEPLTQLTGTIYAKTNSTSGYLIAAAYSNEGKVLAAQVGNGMIELTVPENCVLVKAYVWSLPAITPLVSEIAFPAP